MPASLSTLNFLELDFSQDLLPDRTPSELQEENRYLRFPLGSSQFLLPLESLQEIFRLSPSTIVPVPELPHSILGIYNWRGGLSWMLDLEEFLTGESALSTLRGTVLCLLLPLQDQYLGLLVPQGDLLGALGGVRIESFDASAMLPWSSTITDSIPAHFFAGYFLDADNTPLKLLDPQTILATFAHS